MEGRHLILEEGERPLRGVSPIRNGIGASLHEIVKVVNRLFAPMAAKQQYWKCSDCSSIINDENMHNIDRVETTWRGFPRELQSQYAEFCYGCMNYHPEVVLAYD